MDFNSKNKKKMERAFAIISILVIISMILLYIPGLLK
jgi:competence protein ComGC